jgi:hypothetical protein
MSVVAFAQNQVTGHVADATGEPIIGANVTVKGTTVGTITDIDGNFTLEVGSTDGTLVVSFIGYKSAEAAIKGKSPINVIFRAMKFAERQGEKELFIIGGAAIYKYALSLVDRIYLTEVKTQVQGGDVFFPALSLKNWKRVSEIEVGKNEQNDHDYTMVVLDRK